jgi:RNA polymerase primary sigma factor
MRDTARTVASLDRPLSDEDDGAFGDLMPSDEPGPDDLADLHMLGETVRRALAELPERERVVVGLRYGIGTGQPQPLREIGRRLNLTPERVRQIESAALGRLGRAPGISGLQGVA